ncbi:MAG: FAD-dependent oxidoreductase [Puniceicoccales bacterium]|jgi:hypothetical protein|nr:FAD-dependent oxidoreductase [Puniceicoccales bacterium]
MTHSDRNSPSSRLNRRGFLQKLPAIGAAAILTHRTASTATADNPRAIPVAVPVAPADAKGSTVTIRTETTLPIFAEADICVLGGSCTGVFAAVRAARLGAKVVIVEKQNCFGGVATSSLINIWHSIFDTEKKRQIIAGLTVETMERLGKRKAVVQPKNASNWFTFNSQELKIELDEIVLENKVRPFLNTLFSEPYLDSAGQLAGVIVDGKSGRGVIKAKFFIDATGDADLCVRLGLETYVRPMLQPPTTAAHFEGFDNGAFNSLLKKHGAEFGIPDGFYWGAYLPNTQTYMLAGTRIYGADCSNAKQLSDAEINGRRQIRAMLDMLRKYNPKNRTRLTALSSYIGIRETRHVKCLFQTSDDDALYGKHFDDAIANGSYIFDQHHQDKPGITFRSLDGTQNYVRPSYPSKGGRWRPKTAQNPTFYQVSLRSIIPPRIPNLITAGRMLDAGLIAYSGIRVMVNMNQLGEAAGVAAQLSLSQNVPIQKISAAAVRDTLKKGGSAII